MILNNSFLVEEFKNKIKNVYRFCNIFSFMNFYYNNKLTINNSITYYDKDNNYIYIKKI